MPGEEVTVGVGENIPVRVGVGFTPCVDVGVGVGTPD